MVSILYSSHFSCCFSSAVHTRCRRARSYLNLHTCQTGYSLHCVGCRFDARQRSILPLPLLIVDVRQFSRSLTNSVSRFPSAYTLSTGSSPLSSVPSTGYDFPSLTDSRRSLLQLVESTENEGQVTTQAPESPLPAVQSPKRETSPVDSSSDSPIYVNVRTTKSTVMSSTIPKAIVENKGAKYVPVLTDGEINPNILVVYENTVQDHLEEKGYAAKDQVCKILGGLQGPQVREWFTADRARIQTLSFQEFMAELRAEFLDSNWQDIAEQELLSMVQGDSTFKEFARQLEVANTKLMGTSAHLPKERARQQLIAGLSPALRRHVNNSKAGEQTDYKKWKEIIRAIDDTFIATFTDLEELMKRSRNNTRTSSALSEPS